jgi:hypothetical protein
MKKKIPTLIFKIKMKKILKLIEDYKVKGSKFQLSKLENKLNVYLNLLPNIGLTPMWGLILNKSIFTKHTYMFFL